MTQSSLRQPQAVMGCGVEISNTRTPSGLYYFLRILIRNLPVEIAD